MFRVEASRRDIIRDRERIERILNRHANTCATYSKWVRCIREYVRRKSRWCQGTVPEPAHVLEITEKLEVLAADFAVKRAVEIFTVYWGHCRRESVIVKELFARRKAEPRHILRVVLYVWERVWCWRQSTVIKLWLINKVCDAPSKVARLKISSSKKGRSVDL